MAGEDFFDISPERLRDGFEGKIPEPYLKETKKQKKEVFAGIIWGDEAGRWIISLPCVLQYSSRDPINITFVLDTGCYGCSISIDAANALGWEDNKPSEIRVNELTMKVKKILQPKSWVDKGVNLIGRGLLSQMPGYLFFDYAKKKFYHIDSSNIGLWLQKSSISIANANQSLPFTAEFGESCNITRDLSTIAKEMGKHEAENKKFERRDKSRFERNSRSLITEIGKMFQSLGFKKKKTKHSSDETSSSNEPPSSSDDPAKKRRTETEESATEGQLFFTLYRAPPYSIPFQEVTEDDVKTGWNGIIRDNLFKVDTPIESGPVLQGFLTRDHKRPIISLPCKTLLNKDTIISVAFIVDPQAVHTHIAVKTLQQFHDHTELNSPHLLIVNGVELDMCQLIPPTDPKHFLNILGGDFLRNAKLGLVTDVDKGTFELLPI